METETSKVGYTGRKANENATNELFERICDIFSPLRDYWPTIQDVLLWKKYEISVIIFNVVNVLFWLFLTPRLQLFVGLATLLSLLWMAPPVRLWISSNILAREISTTDNVDSDDSAEILSPDNQAESSEGKITSYEDFCRGVAVILDFLFKYWIKLMLLKEENLHKFYVVVAFLVLIIAVVYALFPIGNILYLTVTFLCLWPAIVFYGIKDRVVKKVHKLFRPFFTQWQSSRTKRKRDALLSEDGHKFSDMSDDEDFTLNVTKSNTAQTPVVLPEEERAKQQFDPSDSINSSLNTFIDGLEFPSLRRDSVESYNSDDFAQGLNFNSITQVAGSHHSSMDSLVVETNETLERDSSLHVTNKENTREEEHEPVELRRRTSEQRVRPLSKSKSLEDFEVIDSSEIEVDKNVQQEQDGNSYVASGTKYVGKLFGYS